MKLTEAAIRAAKPRQKPYKLSDGYGLHLLVVPAGSKLWRFRYRYGGKENMLGLGRYPETTLKQARAKALDCRRQLDNGIDPAVSRQAAREARDESFGAVAEEWLAKQNFAPVTREKAVWLLSFVDRLKGRPLREITPADLLRELRKIEARGLHETAHRVKQRVSQVYRYAVATGRADHDITASLRGALAPVNVKNRAALTDPADVGALLRAIDGYQGQPSVMYALRLAPLVFVRPGELRAAEWSEFDLEAAEWRIPAERMKMGERHIVPLSRQAVAILEELHAITGRGRYLFPSLRTSERCISENTINAALRRLGYGKHEQTGHGFRTIASTLLNETGWHPDLIELQLAHKPRDKVRAAYNRAERLAERRKMMQAWADYLDGLKVAKRGKVRAIRA
jgi:integrase